MALRKLPHVETAKDRAIRHRVMQAKKTRSPVDRTGQYHEALCDLARAYGLDPAAVIEEYEERAAAREYLGQFDRDEAESLAWQDVSERLSR